jgi:hypothetical protein
MTRRNNSGEVPAGHPLGLRRVALGPSSAGWGVALGARSAAGRRGAAGLTMLAAALAVVGCGGADSSGATVSVYVAAPLCAGAKAELASHGASAGHFTVAVRCLAVSERTGRRLDLATAGANSRRATQDTSAVATLEPPGPATKFTRPILESASIPLLTSTSGRTGMKRILEAVEGAGSSAVRESVQKSLEPS